ncbi:hypothetical protein NIES4074_36150 [Cylindrospermum sp. NIES-4074]|nr:hypothetical protein NIES4074_36150 [Cylindrospermum sp. NIES-4074]
MSVTNNITRRIGWVIGSGLVALFAVPASSQMYLRSDINCKEMIVKLVEKSQKLQFLDCKETKSLQLNVLELRYKVAGKDAASVENFLHQKFKMSKLRFLCCGWEPVEVRENHNSSGHGSYRDQRGYYYEVSMFSGETLVNERRDWKNIPVFYVTVTKFLESP